MKQQSVRTSWKAKEFLDLPVEIPCKDQVATKDNISINFYSSNVKINETVLIEVVADTFVDNVKLNIRRRRNRRRNQGSKFKFQRSRHLKNLGT